MSTTEYKNGRLIYTCPHCGHQRDESATPVKNPNPFQFLTGNCSGCKTSIAPDWDVIDAAHQAAFLSSSGNPSCG